MNLTIGCCRLRCYPVGVDQPVVSGYKQGKCRVMAGEHTKQQSYYVKLFFVFIVVAGEKENKQRKLKELIM